MQLGPWGLREVGRTDPRSVRLLTTPIYRRLNCSAAGARRSATSSLTVRHLLYTHKGESLTFASREAHFSRRSGFHHTGRNNALADGILLGMMFGYSGVDARTSDRCVD